MNLIKMAFALCFALVSTSCATSQMQLRPNQTSNHLGVRIPPWEVPIQVINTPLAAASHAGIAAPLLAPFEVAPH